MNPLKMTFNNTRNILLCFALGMPLTACAGTTKKNNYDTPNTQELNIADFEFSLTRGNQNDIPIVTNKKTGKRLAGKKISNDYPIKAVSIEEIKTITIIRAKGSHYFIVTIGGVNYKFDLSH